MLTASKEKEKDKVATYNVNSVDWNVEVKCKVATKPTTTLPSHYWPFHWVSRTASLPCGRIHCVVRSPQAIHAFQGELPCDLSFDAGAVIIILTRSSSQNDWWEGRLQGRVGIFPANYVKVL